MNFQNYINKIKELQKENIYPYELLIADYIESNCNYINDEYLNLNMTDSDFNNALIIGVDYYLNSDSVSLDMISLVSISLAKWNFLSKEEQQVLLSEIGFGGECLSDYLDEYTIEKYAIENEELVR